MTHTSANRCQDHKLAEDHHRYIDAPCDIGAVVRVWKCSYCGEESQWTKKHQQFSAPECRICDRQIVDKVWCGSCKKDEVK